MADHVRANLDYDITVHESMVDDIISLFSVENLSKARQTVKGNPSERPVFIVGMLRSGSSILEQILDGHKDIEGIGESNALADTNNLADMSKWAQDYLDLLPDSLRVVNKQLYNWLSVGLISVMFPNSKIIHTSRDPLETCFSCWKLRFLEQAEWSYSFDELARYYKSYVKLMDHWSLVCPQAFITVEYEDLVLKQEDTVKRVFEYLDVEYDQSCLEFWKNEKPCLTASVDQVKLPLYTSSLNTSDNYRPYLKELIDGLL